MSFYDKETIKEALIYVGIFIITLVLIVFIIIAIDNKKKEDNKEYASFKYLTTNILVDETTNVLYYHQDNGGITPIYNADGTLKLYKEN